MNITELKQEHEALYKEFLPSLDRYQAMAKRALELQIEIFKHRLGEQFPGAVKDCHLVTTISARETPAHLEKVIAEFNRNNVRIDHAYYDDRNFTFYLFATSGK